MLGIALSGDNPFVVMPRHRQSLCYALFIDKSVWIPLPIKSRKKCSQDQIQTMHLFFSWKVILDMVHPSNSLSEISSELRSSAVVSYFIFVQKR